MELVIPKLTSDQAEAIVNLAKSGGLFEGPAPESPDDLVKEARSIYREAYEAYNSGAKGDLVTSILFTGQVSGEENGKAEVSPHPVDEKAQEIQSKFPTFGKIEHDIPPELPLDFSEISDNQLRKLHAIYTSYLVNANWFLAVEESKLRYAESMLDLLENKAYSEHSKQLDNLTEKPKTVLVLQSEVGLEPEVVKAKGKIADLNITARLSKAIRENYSTVCDRLSREWTMRESEK